MYFFRYIINFGGFIAGEFMCKFTSFLDFTMATEYPLILIVFAIILYTRKFPKLEDTLDQFPMDEMINRHSPQPPLNYSRQSGQIRNGSRPPSIQGSRQGSRPSSVQGGRASSLQGGRAAPPSFFRGGSKTPSEQGSRAPSVAGKSF